MKYVIVLGDGMADRPLDELGGKTPLQVAEKSGMDYIASHGITGLCETVPEGMVPESDTANLAVMGYDPKIYSKGRSPLEAMSMGIDLKENQTAIRANLVCLSEEPNFYREKTMIDHSAGEITTAEAKVLIEYCHQKLCGEGMHLYPGVSYRHCFVYDNAPQFNNFSRPHDILGRTVEEYLPSGKGSDVYLELMEKSYGILNDHPINIERAKKGLRKANSLWFWSPGKKPALPSFEERTGLKGTVICAVDLIKGIGLCAGMNVPAVEGATGALDTSYANKGEAAIKALEESDLVYIHVEAPDECGHQGNAIQKIKAIESIDRYIVRPIMAHLGKSGHDYKIMVLPDHPTPIAIRTHAREAVPFAIFDSRQSFNNGDSCYDEYCGQNGTFVAKGQELIDLFISD